MNRITRYKVLSESEGWVTDRKTTEDAMNRAEELNEDPRFSDDHGVKKYTL